MPTMSRRKLLCLIAGAALGSVSVLAAGCEYARGSSQSKGFGSPGAEPVNKMPVSTLTGAVPTEGSQDVSQATTSDDATSADASSTSQAKVEDAPMVVACIGDSLTLGQGATNPSTQSWPAVLNRLLGEHYQVLNYGRGGATVIESAPGCYRRTGLIEAATSQKPAYVTIMFGTNDSRVAWWDPAAFRQALLQTIDELYVGGAQPYVVLIAPPRPFESEFGDLYDGVDSNPVVRDQVRSIIQSVAVERGLDYIDLYEFTCNRPEWYSDGIHLNAEGYEAVAYEVYRHVWG